MNDNYPLATLNDNKIREAYKFACETRKFEIELYWKRATYFWGFLIVTFGGYSVLEKEYPYYHEYKFFIAVVGLFFAFCWYLVNRASKFWQENWEHHILHLENKISGPIYSIPLSPQNFKWYKILDPLAFSISKINQLLSLYVAVLWFCLIVKNILEYCKIEESCGFFNEIILLFVTLIFLVLLITKCKSNLTSDRNYLFIGKVPQCPSKTVKS